MLLFVGFCLLNTVVIRAQNVPNDDLWQCTEEIWASDSNSFESSEITYDLTGSTLFTAVDETRLGTGTYPSFIALLSGFNPNLGESDPDLDAAVDTFINALILTDPIIALHGYLVDWDVFTGTIDAFGAYLKELWFTKYQRGDSEPDASSAFENVFLGEILSDGSAVTGFNGWLNTYQQEQAGDLVYGASGQDCQDDLVSLDSYTWSGATGGPSSVWIGKSAELEIALLTVCYLTRGISGQNCNIEVNGGRAVKVFSAMHPDTEAISYASFECGPGQTTSSPGSTNPTTPPSCGDFFEATEGIWAVDQNSFLPDEYEYDLTPDTPLFTSVDEARFSTGTYPALITLLEGFNHQLGEADPDLTAEVEVFLDAVMATGPMLAAFNYSLACGLTESLENFRDQIRQFWFTKYGRSDNFDDSSGFEHVFQGEVREDGSEVTGMHGWVHVYFTEKNGDFEFGRSDLDCDNDLIQINDCFYHGADKPITSIWIGRSPEVELALFTVCFLTSRNTPCDISVDGGYRTDIVNYDMSGVSPTTIGTAYFGC